MLGQKWFILRMGYNVGNYINNRRFVLFAMWRINRLPVPDWVKVVILTAILVAVYVLTHKLTEHELR